jgi:hypothetical protein
VTPDIAFRISEPAPGVLLIEELPYLMAGWCAIAAGVTGAAIAVITQWRESGRLKMLMLLGGAAACGLLGLVVIGLSYEYSFDRAQSAIDIHSSWFGNAVSQQHLVYKAPPRAEVVTTRNTTHQLVLRFQDGSVRKLGLSTSRAGHDEVAAGINRFLSGGSFVQ